MSFLKSKHYLKNVQVIIDNIGDEQITEIKIARKPLSKAVTFLLNITSLGEFNRQLKKTPHDKLFHLFMVITTSKGGKFVLEKNEAISMSKFTSFTKETETINVSNIKNNLTLNILLVNTKNKMNSDFFDYQGLTNNCQNFISNILKSNGLNTDDLNDFVLQNTKALFNNNPKLRKLLNTITDIGAIGSNIIQKVDEISKQPIYKSIQNELIQPIFRGLTLNNLLKKGFSNPFERK
jgi:hypothetical protein